MGRIPPQGAAGVRKLSRLKIDVDKDWLGHRIVNLGAPISITDACRLVDAQRVGALWVVIPSMVMEEFRIVGDTPVLFFDTPEGVRGLMHDGTKFLVVNDLGQDDPLGWISEINMLPEGAKTGLPADSTGVKYDQPITRLLDEDTARFASSAYLEYGKGSSAGDETTRLHLYCVTCGADVVTDDQQGAVARKRVDASAVLDHVGHEVKIRAEVVTASATSGATFDLYFVVLLLSRRVR